jgi:hypothetical protein
LQANVSRIFPDAQIVYGWCYDGAVHARYGWYLRWPDNHQEYLGRSFMDVFEYLGRAREKMEVQQ